MKLLESSQIALVAGGWEREGLPYMYDEFGGSGDRDMFNFNDTFGFLESQSPEEGTGPRPEPGSPGLSQVLDTLNPPNCTTWVRAGVRSEGGPYYDVGFECTRNGVGRP
jgi:hypothetical protein